MDINEFEHEVLMGAITDFDIFFDEQLHDFDDLSDEGYPYHFTSADARWVLAKNNIALDRCIEVDGNFLIVDLVKEGLFPERYAEWRKRGPVAAQWFIENGLFLNDYITSDRPDVRRWVMEKDIRYCLERMDCEEDRRIIHHVIKSHRNPPPAVIEAYLKTEWSKDYNNDGIRMKHEALTRHLDTFSKTMTSEQLYECGHPAWAKDVNAYEVQRLLAADKELKDMGYTGYTNHLFDAVINAGKAQHPVGCTEDITEYVINQIERNQHG